MDRKVDRQIHRYIDKYIDNLRGQLASRLEQKEQCATNCMTKCFTLCKGIENTKSVKRIGRKIEAKASHTKEIKDIKYHELGVAFSYGLSPLLPAIEFPFGWKSMQLAKTLVATPTHTPTPPPCSCQLSSLFTAREMKW